MGTAPAAAPSQRAPAQAAQRAAQQQATTQGQQVHATIQLAPVPAFGMPLASAWGPATAHFQTTEPAAPAMAPAEEMAHIRTTLKSRKDFAKTLHGMIAANPSDGFSSMVLATIDQDITVLNSRLDALRPPEARLNQLTGELKHKTNLHAKLVAELAALDLSRTLLQTRVQASQEELAQLQIDFDQLKPPPTEVPGPAMAAFQQVLVNLGQGPLFDQLMSHLQGLGLNVNAGLRVEATGSPAAAPLPPALSVRSTLRPRPLLSPRPPLAVLSTLRQPQPLTVAPPS